MMKAKKSSKGLALVLAAVLALTPMAGFPLTALATGEAAAPKAEAPATDAGDAPATDAGETPQADAPAADADANTDTAPGTTPSTPAVDAEAPQAEAPATDAGTNPGAAGSVTKPPATNAVTPDLTPTPTPNPDAANDGVVNEKDFPDPIFWAYVRDKFDTNKDDILDTGEIKAATEIDVVNQGIATLQGVKYFTALTHLSCSNTPWASGRWNTFTTLDVSANTALTVLNCGNNNLITLDVSANTALTYLSCGNSSLSTLDVSSNVALIELYCANNELTTLDVSANPALTSLLCENNQLTTLDLTGQTGSFLAVSLGPQAPHVPVVKRGESEYELDIKALAKGRTLTAITLGETLGETSVDLETYQKMRDAAPTSLQYFCETGFSAGYFGKEMMVATKNFAYSYLATLDAGTNGTLTFDGTPSASGEILLAEKSEPTFTVTPASGYQVATLTVNEKDAKGSLETKDATSQTLQLLPVTDVVTIAVTFEKIPAPPTPIINYYSVTPTVENGTITPEHPTTVREGNSLKYAFSPKEGYALESVSVNGKAVEAADDSTATTKTYSHTINSIYGDTTIHVVFKAVEPPVDPTDPVDPPKPPVDPVDPVDPPKPPVDPADPVVPPTPPALPDNGGNGNNNGGGTTIVERINTVVVPVAPQAAALAAPETPATAAAPAAKTEAAPAKAAADNAAPQGQLENPALGAQGFDAQHSHLPLALLLLAVWLVGGFAVIRQRKHAHDAIEGTSY